jgi:hypothetical protein
MALSDVRRLAVLFLLTTSGCGVTPTVQNDTGIPNSRPARYKVTAVSASIASTIPAGQPEAPRED